MSTVQKYFRCEKMGNYSIPPVVHVYMTRGKSFCYTSFQVGIDLKKVQKQGRDERM